MARPSLEIGTHGSVNTVRMTEEGVKPEAWRARTRFRDTDGVTRPVERWGPSKTKAEKALNDALDQRRGKPAAQLKDGTRFRDLAAIYLDQVKARRAGGTYDRYRVAVNKHLVPVLGTLRIRECTTARFQDVLDELDEVEELSGSYRSLIRSVIRGIMQIAVRRELVDTNPGRDLDRIENRRKRKKPRALTAEELSDFLVKLDADQTARDADLCDLMRLLFGTGLRVSEALGLRWCDLNMTDEPVRMQLPDGTEEKVDPHSLWVNGAVVYTVGNSTTRNEGKTFAARRVVGIPDFLHTLLLVRRDEFAFDNEPIFPSPKSGNRWKYPRSVARSLQKVRERIGYPELTTHWGRKTVATLLDDAGQTPRQVADQLGHADIAVTQRHYFARNMANPGAVAAIDAWHKRKPNG